MKRLTFRNTAAALLAAALFLPFVLQAQQTYTAGEPHSFTLVARDTDGNVLRNWDHTGTPVTVKIYSSTANTDSSAQSWNADPDGYSWVRVLHNGAELPKIADYEWTVDPTRFSNGAVTLELIQSKAEDGIYYEILPRAEPLNQISESFNFTPAVATNFGVVLTSSVPGSEIVYIKRKYEITITPRDRYMNTVTETVPAVLGARWPGEFSDDEPGLADMFPGRIFITGPTNYFFASTTPHGRFDKQQIQAFNPDDASFYGMTTPYEIRDHAPGAFKLLTPADQTLWYLDVFTKPLSFSWETAVDPYTDIKVAASDTKTVSDVVKYEVYFLDNVSLTMKQSYESDNSGRIPGFTTTQGWLNSVGEVMAGKNFSEVTLVWVVRATDGLYITKNTPTLPGGQIPGNRLHLERWIHAVENTGAAPTGVALHQNYPNPVASGSATNIRFETGSRSPVTLKVYDMLGSEVATLADEVLDAGSYNAEFRAAGLAPGVYHYILSAEGRTVTRNLVVTK